MTLFRVSVGWLMLAVALIGFHLAVISSYPPALGMNNLEVGLLPSVTLLTVVGFSMTGCHGKRSHPFVWGFVSTLTVAILVYLVCCLTTPNLVRWPVVYYINEIEPGLYDADLAVIYRLSLEIQGLILGVRLFNTLETDTFDFSPRNGFHGHSLGD